VLVAPAFVVGAVVAAVAPALWWLQVIVAGLAGAALQLWLHPRLVSDPAPPGGAAGPADPTPVAAGGEPR